MSGSSDRYKGVSAAVESVRERMARAAERAGRSPDETTLVAVTKFHPAEAVQAAYAAGLRHFGENRVQEAAGKFQGLSLPGASLHLLGHLQGNKVKKAVGFFDCVQSADSAALIAELGRRAVEAGRVIDLLLELRTGEASKSGFPDADSLLYALESAAGCPGVRLRGLMTMAPFVEDASTIRAAFRACRACHERARGLLGLDTALGGAFDTLSMGMTNDFELAIEEGATMVRIGTAFFGERAET